MLVISKRYKHLFSLEKLKSIYSYETIVILLIEGLLFTLFSEIAVKVTEKILINPILSTVKSTIQNDIYIFALVISVSYFLIKKNIKWPQNVSLVILIANLFLYILFRQNQIFWQLTEFHSIDSLYYSDSIAVLCLLILIKSGFEKDRTILNGNSILLEDLPISLENEDEILLAPYAKHIFETVNGTSLKQAFTIGINGKWGTGKTSLINLIRNQCNPSRHLFVEFNPWKYSNTSLQSKFFEDLLATLGHDKLALNSKIARYSKKINNSNSGQVAMLFSFFLEYFRPSKNTEELLTDIKTEINKLEKQLFIVLDDLDRLHSDELFEVLKIIRNTANFPNTIYLIAYDRSYIDNALESINDYNAKGYLEKIVNLELVLPGLQNRTLPEMLLHELSNGLEEQDVSILAGAIRGSFSESAPFIVNSLQSIRHVKRIVNSFRVNTANLIGEIDVSDFLILELIRSNYPSAYTLFQKNYLKYLEVKENDNKLIGIYQLKAIPNPQQVDESTLEKSASTHFELDWIRSDNKITQNDLLWIKKAFHLLFPFSYARKHDDSICFSNRTERYLSYSLYNTDLARQEFEATLKLGLNQIKEKIDLWINENKEFAIKQLLYKLNLPKDIEQSKKIIEVIFYFASQSSNLNLFFFNNLIWYDSDDLVTKIYGIYTSIPKTDTDAQENFKIFIENLLMNREHFPIYSSSLVKHNLDRNTQYLPLEKDTLEKINVFHLQEQIDSTKALDELTWFYFNNCKIKKWIQISPNYWTSSESEYLTRSIVLMKELILQKEVDKYILDLVRRDYFDNEIVTLSDSFMAIFGSLNEFILTLKEATVLSIYKEEFIEFLSYIDQNNQNLSLKYTFKTIPI